MDPMYHPSTHMRVRGRRAASDTNSKEGITIAEEKVFVTDDEIADQHSSFLISLGLLLFAVVLLLSVLLGLGVL
jgi:hypothetical protein